MTDNIAIDLTVPPFYSLPIKTSTNINFKSLLSKAYINKSNDVDSLLEKLTNTRNNLLEFFKHENGTRDEAIKVAQEYLPLLSGLVGAKAATNEGEQTEQKSVSNLRNAIEFSWTNVADSNAKTQLRDAVFEKASVLLNLALWYMSHGASMLHRPNTSKDEANKDAYHSFLNASWILETIENEELSKLKSDDLPKDLSADFIVALKLQALAQAQEITILRAIDQKNKANLIAGLAHEVFNKYNEASDKAKAVGSKAEKLREYLKARRNYNAALSYILTGADFNENDKNGEAMACAAAAISSLKKN